MRPGGISVSSSSRIQADANPAYRSDRICRSLPGRGIQLAAGDEVLGFSLHSSWPARWAHLEGVVPLVACDLVEGTSLDEALARFRPERICHLAGYARPGRSYTEPAASLDGQPDGGDAAAVRGRRSLLAAGLSPRILFISTGLVYGDSAPNGPPQGQEATPHSRSVVSPYAAEQGGGGSAGVSGHARHPGLNVVRARRPFNHIGPGRAADYAVANFARQLAAIGRTTQPPLLETGDLRPMRDLCDVRDVVAAYVALLEKGSNGGAYNVASGTSRAMQDVLERMISISGMKVEVRQRIDPADA